MFKNSMDLIPIDNFLDKVDEKAQLSALATYYDNLKDGGILRLNGISLTTLCQLYLANSIEGSVLVELLRDNPGVMSLEHRKEQLVRAGLTVNTIKLQGYKYFIDMVKNG